MNKELDFFNFQEQNAKDLELRIKNLEEENEFTQKLSKFLFILGLKFDSDFHFEYIGWNNFIFHFGDHKIIYRIYYSEVIFTLKFNNNWVRQFSFREYERKNALLQLLRAIYQYLNCSDLELKSLEELLIYSPPNFIHYLNLSTKDLIQLSDDKSHARETAKSILNKKVKLYEI